MHANASAAAAASFKPHSPEVIEVGSILINSDMTFFADGDVAAGIGRHVDWKLKSFSTVLALNRIPVAMPTHRTYRGSRDDSFGLHSQTSFNTGSADAV